MNEPRVLLTTLSFQVSEKTGRTYCMGWMGRSKRRLSVGLEVIGAVVADRVAKCCGRGAHQEPLDHDVGDARLYRIAPFRAAVSEQHTCAAVESAVGRLFS